MLGKLAVLLMMFGETGIQSVCSGTENVSPISTINRTSTYDLYERLTGFGSQTFDDVSMYEGWYEDGIPHGSGTLSHQYGKVFHGKWVEGKRSGKSTLIFSDGTELTAEWNGSTIIDGKARTLFPDGSLYEGQYRGTQRHGYGEMRYASGFSYRGGVG